MTSNCTGLDDSVQFRLRINQKGNWSAWDRIVNSFRGQGPSLGNPKWYDLFFDPLNQGTDDDLLVFNFDILSFSWDDDVDSWIMLDELVISEATIESPTMVQEYTFDSGSEGWLYQGLVPPYDEPTSSTTGGHLGLSPAGSWFCFSYWESPENILASNKVYRALFELSSSVSNNDDAVQFRLRINQKGAWQSWDRVVNSKHLHAPSNIDWKTYQVLFDPIITGAEDDDIIFNFDIMSFDTFDDIYSWLYLESFTLEDITISP